MHASSGIRTHDPSVWAGEDVSYIRQRGHFDRQNCEFLVETGKKEMLFQINSRTFSIKDVG
jgi:hypothetical protein